MGKPGRVASPDSTRSRRARGEEIQTTIFLPLGLRKLIQIHAIKHNTTMSKLIEEAIVKHIAPALNGRKPHE
jgi:hypothetical protein